MGNEEEKGQTKEEEKRLPIIKLKGIPVSVIVIVSVIILAVVPIFMSITNTTFEPTRATLMTFWVSFCLGTAGACVYLSVLLITEKNIELLKNDAIRDVYLMTILFLFSGGLVAATVQTSTGIFTPNSIYAVFLLGFGWQGAISGVAGAPTRQRLAKDLGDCGKTNSLLNKENSELENLKQVQTAMRLLEKIKKCSETRQKLQEKEAELLMEVAQLKAEKAKTSNRVGA